MSTVKRVSVFTLTALAAALGRSSLDGRQRSLFNKQLVPDPFFPQSRRHRKFKPSIHGKHRQTEPRRRRHMAA